MGKRVAHRPEQVGGIELLDLVGNIYQAGLEPDLWPQVLKQISTTFEADLACIYTPSVSRAEQAIYLTHNFAESTQAAYSAYYHQLDAWTLSALEMGIYNQGLVAFGEQLIPSPALHRTEFYHDFLKPGGMEWIVTTALFDGHVDPNTPATHMTFTRHADHAAFEPTHARLIDQLAPHVRRALITHWRLTEAQQHSNLQATALYRAGYGLILTDPEGKVMHLSPLAEKHLQAAEGLSIQAGCLHAMHPAEQDALTRLIHEASLGLGGTLNLQRHTAPSQPTLPPYHLTATPMREGQNLAAFGPHTIAPRPGVLLMLQAANGTPAEDGLQRFTTQHRITPAETQVLQLLLQDLAPKQIASQLDVAIRTVRTQLSSLYTKTGTRNQRELVRAAMASVI